MMMRGGEIWQAVAEHLHSPANAHLHTVTCHSAAVREAVQGR